MIDVKECLNKLYRTSIRGYHSKKKRQRKKSRKQTPLKILLRQSANRFKLITSAIDKDIWQMSRVHVIYSEDTNDS